MILRNLLRRKLRTFFAFSGVALGIASVVALTAISQGILRQLHIITHSYRGDMIVMQEGVPDPVFSSVDPEIAVEMSKWPEISGAYPLMFTGMQLEEDPFVFVFGIPADSALLKRHHLVEGRYFEAGKNEILMGSGMAKKLRKKINDKVEVRQQVFTVVGIFQIDVRVVDHAFLADVPDAMKLSKVKAGTNMIVLDLHNLKQDEKLVAETVKREYPGLEALNSGSIVGTLQQINMMETAANIIMVIAVVMAGIGILNTMMMSVYERTREIGLLRALGWSRKMILTMILGEGLVLSLTGCIFGIGFGMAGTELLIETMGTAALASHYPPSLFINSFWFAVVIGLGGAFVPAWKASLFSPVEALRYE